MTSDTSIEKATDRATVLDVEATNRALWQRVADLEHALDVAKQRCSQDALRIQRDLAIALSSTSDLTEAMHCVLTTLLQIDGIDCGGIYLIDRHSGALNLIVSDGLPSQFTKHIQHYKAASPHVHIVMQGKPLYGAYKDVVPVMDEVRTRQGMRFLAAIPVKFEERVLAVLNLASHTHDDIPTDSRIILEAIAAQIGGVIARMEMSTALQERERQLHVLLSEMEQRIEERTAELGVAVQELQRQMQEREQVEEQYRTFVETAPNALLLTNLDGTIWFCNEQAARLFGFAHADELCGKKGIDLVGIEQTSDPLRHLQMVEESGMVRNMEYTLHRQDGSAFPVEVNSSVVHDSEGKPKALSLVVRDISERKEAEQALTTAYADLSVLSQHLIRSRNLLRAIFDGLKDGLVLLDATGCVQAINTSLARLLGNSEEELVGQNWAVLFPRLASRWRMVHGIWDMDEENHEHAGYPSYQFLSSHERPERIRYRGSDGSTLILDVQTIALRGEDETVEQVIVHVVDVTEHVLLQARVIDNELFAASGKMIASVAHEINTPLQSIQSFLELIHLAHGDDDRALFVASALEETQRAGRIVHQLLDLYRPDATVYGPLDMSLLIERLFLLLGKRFRDQGVVVNIDCANDMPPVWGRTDDLMQVLLNLMVNALDAMPDGGTLKVTCRVSDEVCIASPLRSMVESVDKLSDTASIAITDSGCGISPEIQARLFDPFVTTKEHGTGLGLSISKHIVEQHGGCIRVQSELDRGSTFVVVLPLANADICS